MKSHSPINFRPFLVIALFVLSTAFAVYVYALEKVAGIVVGVILISGTACGFTVALVKFIRKTAKLRFCITFGLCTVLCVLSMALGANYVDFRETANDFSGYREVYGRICYINSNGGIVLDKLEINGERIGGKLSLKVASDDRAHLNSVRCGDYLHFDDYVSVGNFINDDYTVNGYSVRTGIVFYTDVKADDVVVSFGKSMPIKNFLRALNELFVENMGERYGNLAFAMLTGDKSGLADQEMYFNEAGLGHIMAVSGLHVGFFILLLNFILAKVDKRIRFPIIGAVLFAYMIVADFSPSVVRAFIMAAVAMIAFAVGGRRDILSSMCCAMSLILAFKPLYIFEAGFVLSFGAIFGIAMFSDTVKRALGKFNVHDKVGEAMGTSISVQAGIVPAQIGFFNEIQVFAPIVNMILIPYISAVFIVILVSAPIAAIPGCGPLLKLGMYLLMPIDAISQGIAAAPFAVISHYSTFAVFLCYPVMFLVSKFFMMPRGKVSVAAAAVFTCATLCAVPYPSAKDFLCVVNCGTTESVVYADGKTYVIGYAADRYKLKDALDANHLHKIDAVYLLGATDDTFDTLLYLDERYELGSVYCHDAGDIGVRLLQNGIDFRLTDDGNDAETVRLAGEFVGYEYCDILFAADGADEIGFLHYAYVRADGVEYLCDGVTYYCNRRLDCEFDGDYYAVYGRSYYIDLYNSRPL